MKAVIYSKYGGPEVLKLTEIAKPVPKSKEILIKVSATTVTSGDVRLRSSDFPPLFWLPARFIFGLFKPKKRILGHELSGVVEALGNEVTQFKIGDEIFGTTTMLRTGAYAEYTCLPERWKHGVVAKKPKNLNFEESAALPIGGMTALFLLEKAGLNKGQNVLIYGASGSVGSYAVQLAKSFGASVAGVCSTSNIDMVKSLGAQNVVDYSTQDFTQLKPDFDIVLDAVGKISKSRAKKILKKEGTFVTVQMITQEKLQHLIKLKDLAEAGEIKPFIDRHYGLESIAEAHTYVDSSRKRGNLIIKVEK